MALAIKLYELGRLTSEQAAALASVSRVAFLLACPQFGTASVQWDRVKWTLSLASSRRERTTDYSYCPLNLPPPAVQRRDSP